MSGVGGNEVQITQLFVHSDPTDEDNLLEILCVGEDTTNIQQSRDNTENLR